MRFTRAVVRVSLCKPFRGLWVLSATTAMHSQQPLLQPQQQQQQRQQQQETFFKAPVLIHRSITTSATTSSNGSSSSKSSSSSKVLKRTSLSNGQLLLEERQGALGGPPVYLLTLNRPNALNAISLTVLEDLLRFFKSKENEKGIILLTGAGDKAFCAGQSTNPKP